MTTLVLRLVLAPSFVILISLVARRFGARAGGVVGGLPVIVGPILLVLSLDKGTAFARDAADGAMLGVIALIGFVLAYVAASVRFSWPFSILAGWSAFFVLVGALRPVHVGSVAAVALACAACAVGLIVLPRRAHEPSADYSHPRWDLAVRAGCAAVPVVVITGLAGLVGAHVAGLLASFPVITPVVAAFTHAQRGRHEVARLLYGFTAGFFAYALFCFTIAIAVVRLGTGAAFALGAAVALAVQALTVTLAVRR